MTLDEAKKTLREMKNGEWSRDEALDIALWLLEREPMVVLLRAEIDAEFCFELRVLDEWERADPRPGVGQ